jgi:hypothetical protein
MNQLQLNMELKQFLQLLSLMLGKIVARDLRGDELRAKNFELLAK